jgi:hypothetical protein
MLSVKTFNLITYTSLLIIFLLLVGILVGIIPQRYHIHALIVAIALFIVRIVLRFWMAIQLKKRAKGDEYR